MTSTINRRILSTAAAKLVLSAVVPAGALAGKISFSNRDGHEMTFVLRNDQIQKILGIVSEAMVDTVVDLAEGLTKDIIEATPVMIAADPT